MERRTMQPPTRLFPCAAALIAAATALAPPALAGTATLVFEARLDRSRFDPENALMLGATFRCYLTFDTDASPDAVTASSATYRTAWTYEFVDRPLGEPDLRATGPKTANGPFVRLEQGAEDLVIIRLGNAGQGVFTNLAGATVRLDGSFFPGAGPPSIADLASFPPPLDPGFSNVSIDGLGSCDASPYLCMEFVGDIKGYYVFSPRVMQIPGPAVYGDPDSAAVGQGDVITLEAEALTAGAATYSWSLNGTPLANGGRVSGADGPALTIVDAQLLDSGAYTLAVTDDGSTTVSDGAVVAVVPGPDCNADINGDGFVDIFDFADLADNFGAGPDATREQGDLNGDGFVDIFDFADLADDFGCGL
jgi:hypothetical protein